MNKDTFITQLKLLQESFDSGEYLFRYFSEDIANEEVAKFRKDVNTSIAKIFNCHKVVDLETAEDVIDRYINSDADEFFWLLSGMTYNGFDKGGDRPPRPHG